MRRLIDGNDGLWPLYMCRNVGTGLVNLQEIDGLGKGCGKLLQEPIEAQVIQVREGVKNVSPLEGSQAP